MMASPQHTYAAVSNSDRRGLPRLAGAELQIVLRQRGSLRRSAATALDFNRHGIAVLAEQPLRLDVPMVLKLSHSMLPGVIKVVGIVHNCARIDARYRCGIAFRPRSPFQSDSEFVEAQLQTLEAMLLERAQKSA